MYISNVVVSNKRPSRYKYPFAFKSSALRMPPSAAVPAEFKNGYTPGFQFFAIERELSEGLLHTLVPPTARLPSAIFCRPLRAACTILSTVRERLSTKRPQKDTVAS
jgi:hypothetical protein